MEPVTHVLMGAVLGRAGVNRRAAYATAAMAVAAEFPDIDVVWGWFGGPVTGLEHHRGITHTFVGLPVEAAVIVAGVWGWHRWRGKATKAPVSWWLLYGGVMVALLSHLLLDWTNNYGVRPFFPFDPRWFAGSFVFIFEPVLFGLLVAALVFPGLFGLINSEVGAARVKFRGRGWAWAALVGVAGLYGFRYDQRNQALKLAATVAPADAGRMFASPYPLDPFRWRVVTETPEAYLLNTVNTRMPAPNGAEMTVYKPAATMPVLVAKRTLLGRIYLDWSQYPVISEMADTTDPNHPLSAVTFSDARFYYNVSFFHGVPENGKAPPLSGTVLLDMAAKEGERVVETRMGKTVQK